MISIQVEPKQKKSIVEYNHFYKDGMIATLETGWRWGSFSCDVYQEDLDDLRGIAEDNFTEETEISCYENFECDHTWDGCWCDWSFSENVPEVERALILKEWEENGNYPDDYVEGWEMDISEYFIYGPLDIKELSE